MRFKKNLQIIGIIENNNIFSIVSSFSNPIYHQKIWPYSIKRWRYNIYDGLIESELSKEKITKEEMIKIKEYLKKRYKIYD